MSKLKAFVGKALLGGVLVLLPVAILLGAFKWVFTMVTGLIQPLTNVLIKNNGLPEVVGDSLAVLLITLGCFAVGALVSTGVGKWLHDVIDENLTRFAPGYKLTKGIVGQFIGDKTGSPFTNGEVAKAKIFGGESGTTVSAIVTCRHEDGSFTVFVPTGPNPTSGNMYHLPEEQVELFPNASVEELMKTIIACGAGSDALFSDVVAPVAVSEGTEAGIVKWFSTDKGYGFIQQEDGSEVFVHFRSIVGEGRRILREGQDVTFDVVDSDKGPQAENVKALNS
ncbi:hypothetical protein A9Q99_22005 [Gammaproteobacteria bacterium 45_16_T64]|nr:hypothetical protein A9Q99_22005 [Gammaproteobacteria bacterium 45_16_T64]